MKHIYSILSNTVLIVVALLFAVGCSDDFLDVNDPNSLGTDNVFQDFAAAQQAVNAAYAPLKEIDLYGDELHFFLHQITDEYGLLFQGDDGWNQMKNFSMTPDNKTIDAVWGGLGKMVLRANGAIEGLENTEISGDFTAAQRDELLGQAYFLRGLALFMGANIFGAQPISVDANAPGYLLITAVPTSREATLVPRATMGEVYAQLLSDWETAETLLPDEWSGNDLGRVTKGAAAAFLGKAYLYQKDWDMASTQFMKVISNAEYQLLPDFADNFNGQGENGSESVFEVQFSDASPIAAWNGGPGHTYATRHAPAELGAFGNVFIPPTSYARMATDPRAAATIIAPGDFLPFIDTVYVGNGPEDYRPRKFINVNGSQINNPLGATFNGFINMPMMRLADVYLMYAEAQNELGNTSEALEYVNKVRRRAFQQPVDTPSDTADINVGGGMPLLAAIQDERFIELFAEGHRWFDLLRWGLATTALGDRGFQASKHQAMPIPLDETQLNKNIKQNPGY